MNRARSPTHAPDASLSSSSTRSSSPSATLYSPLFWYSRFLARRTAINPVVVVGSGIIEIIIRQRTEIGGPAFQDSSASAHTIARAQLSTLPFCVNRACVLRAPAHKSLLSSLSLSLFLWPASARYHPGSGNEHENEGPRNNESPGYPLSRSTVRARNISCSDAHRVHLVSAISPGEKMIAIAGGMARRRRLPRETKIRI